MEAGEELETRIRDFLIQKDPSLANHFRVVWEKEKNAIHIICDSWFFQDLIRRMEGELKKMVSDRSTRILIDTGNETDRRLHPDLDSRMTFENFVVDNFNKTAYHAAIEVTENPGEVHNPLFIYGGYGIGKTHILNAIGHRLYATRPGFKIFYTNPDEIMNRYISAMMNGSNLDFVNELLENDVLLIDDIQCFKESWVKTGEALFTVLNSFLRKHKQIVVTSDENPFKLNNIPQRLRSRLTYGLMAEIKPPDYGARKKIIQHKIKERNYLPFTEEALEIFAKNAPENIREIENLLHSLNFRAKLEGKQVITKEFLIQELSHIVSFDNNKVSVEKILRGIGNYFNINPGDLKSNSRTKTISEARHIAIYLIREMLNYSYKEIGKIFGRKHSTVISSYQKIKEKISNDKTFETEIEIIKNMIINGQKR